MIFSETMTCGSNDNCEDAPAGSCTDTDIETFTCSCNAGWTGPGQTGTCVGE